jgi:hypothetical protein
MHMKYLAYLNAQQDLAYLNAQKVIFELLAWIKRAENKLAICMSTVYKSHLDPEIQPTADGQRFLFLCKSLHGAYSSGKEQWMTMTRKILTVTSTTMRMNS